MKKAGNDTGYWARTIKTTKFPKPQIYVASSSSEDENDDLNDRVDMKIDISPMKVEARAAAPP